MNEVTTNTGSTAVATNATYNPYAAAAKDMGAIEGHYLKFSGKTGDWTYGKEEQELPPGTQLAVDMAGITRGWVCWKEGVSVEEISVNILTGEPPPQHTLTDHGPYKTYDDGTTDGWQEQTTVPFRNVEDGECYTFKSSSKSAKNSIAALLSDYGKLFRRHPNETVVVEIDQVSFKPKTENKRVDKVYAPVLKIVGWMTRAQMEALDDLSPEGSDDPSNYEQNTPSETAKVAETAKIAEPEKPVEKAVQPEQEAVKTETTPATGRRGKRF